MSECMGLFEQLPWHLMQRIFTFLEDVEDLMRCCMVSKGFLKASLEATKLHLEDTSYKPSGREDPAGELMQRTWMREVQKRKFLERLTLSCRNLRPTLLADVVAGIQDNLRVFYLSVAVPSWWQPPLDKVPCGSIFSLPNVEDVFLEGHVSVERHSLWKFSTKLRTLSLSNIAVDQQDLDLILVSSEMLTKLDLLNMKADRFSAPSIKSDTLRILKLSAWSSQWQQARFFARVKVQATNLVSLQVSGTSELLFEGPCVALDSLHLKGDYSTARVEVKVKFEHLPCLKELVLEGLDMKTVLWLNWEDFKNILTTTSNLLSLKYAYFFPSGCSRFIAFSNTLQACHSVRHLIISSSYLRVTAYDQYVDTSPEVQPGSLIHGQLLSHLKSIQIVVDLLSQSIIPFFPYLIETCPGLVSLHIDLSNLEIPIEGPFKVVPQDMLFFRALLQLQSKYGEKLQIEWPR